MSQWYKNLTINKQNFREIVLNFNSIIGDVLNPKFIRSVNAVKGYDQIANCSPLTKEIFINEDYFYGEHPIVNSFTYDERLMIVTGTILHEVSHLRWSDKNGLEALIPERHRNNKFAEPIANICEDVYIETRLEDMFPYTKSFLSIKNRCFFDDYFIEDSRKNFNGFQPLNEVEADNFLDFFMTWKRRDSPVTFISDFERGVYTIFNSILFEHEAKNRSVVVGKILDLLPFVEVKNKDKKDVKSLKQSSVEVYSSNVKRTFLKIEEIVQVKGCNTVVVFKDLAEEPRNLIEIEDFSQITLIENCKSAVRFVKGSPRYSGKRITNLIHYNQGNIFGIQSLEGKNFGVGKPEVIVLVDFSGSMLYSIEEKKNTTKLNFALSCLGGLYNALVDSNIPVACYGHTTSHITERAVSSLVEISPTIFTLSSFAKPLTKGMFHAKLSAVVEKASTINNSNADATAIITMADLFTKSQGDKILIVISDGLPAAVSMNYDALKGYDTKESDIKKHTKKVVELVRGRGVKVHSLSIDKTAVKANDFIYGYDFNSFVLDKQQFVEKIIKSLN